MIFYLYLVRYDISNKKEIREGFVNNIFTENCDSLKILFKNRFGIEFIPEANYQ